jgi:hypothetical protein
MGTLLQSCILDVESSNTIKENRWLRIESNLNKGRNRNRNYVALDWKKRET